MISNEFSAQSSQFLSLYLQALRGVLSFHEDKANSDLNKVKHFMRSGESAAIAAAHPDSAKIFADLNKGSTKISGDFSQGLDRLYGDYKSTSVTPWLKGEKTLSMISEHIALLGTKEDLKQAEIFFQKTKAFYGTAPGLRLSA